jgi:hypothetical protein
MNELKTGYEWCVSNKINLVKLSQWPTTMSFYMESFYEEKISYSDFFERIKSCDIKLGEIPVPSPLYLKYRMYGLVPYNLSPIQQGIQFGHAVVEYGQFVKGIPPFEGIYDKFACKDKTFIILNGGTTNENTERLGTLQQHAQTLKDNEILIAEFREPDLNDTLTAVVFLVDERVYNKELYPDFLSNPFLTGEENDKSYNNWVKNIGGPKNEFLRKFLSGFRLA